jgi:TonB family protein
MKKTGFFTTWICLCAVWAFGADTDPEVIIEMPTDTLAGTQQQSSSSSGDSLFQIDKMPEITEFIKADYPTALLKQGVQGTVLLELLVNETGTVDSVKVVTGLNPVLDSTASVAAHQFKFTPATAGGQPVAVLLQYEYRFTIDEAVDTIQKVVNFEGLLIESGTRKPISDAMVVLTFADTSSDSSLPLPFSMYMEKIGTIDGQSLEENKLVALTDSLGKFTFYALPACSVQVAVVIPGYEAFKTNELISRKEAIGAKYYVKRYSYSDYEIVVYGKSEEKEVSRRQLTVQEIKLIPGLGGDAVKVVQAMPGVARPSFGSGAIVVRGAPTYDSKFYIDGVVMPILYHFGGLKSAYNSDALQSIDFLPGGFGTRYGGAVAGTIELKSRPAATDRWHGKLDLGTIDGSFLLEGPINKKVSVLVTARRSFIGDIVSWASKKYSDVFPVTISSFYWDYTCRTDVNFSENNHLFLTFFGSSDSMAIIQPDGGSGSEEVSEQTDRFGMNTTFNMGLVGWDYTLNDRWSNSFRFALTKGRSGYSVFGFMRSETDFVVNHIRDQLTYRFNDKLLVNIGPDIELTKYDIDMKIPDASNVIQHDKKNDWWFGVVGAYMNLEWKPIEKLQIIPGIRYDYYPELKYDGSIVPEFWDYQSFDNKKGISGEPSARLNARYSLSKNHSLKASAGNYSQTPQPVGQVIHETWGDPTMPPTKAAHYVLGHEWQITDVINSDVQLYLNRQWNIPQYGSNSDATSGGETQKLWTGDGKGRMYGLEVMLRHLKSEHFFGWIAYTLSRTERYNDAKNKWELYDEDETHNLQVLGSWHVKKEWDLGFRARYVTGKPTTPIIGVVEKEQDRSFEPVYGEKNSTRLDPFFQLDLRADKKFVYDKWMYSLYIDLQNISYFFYKSPEYQYDDYNYKNKNTVTSFPWLGIGCKAEF